MSSCSQLLSSVAAADSDDVRTTEKRCVTDARQVARAERRPDVVNARRESNLHGEAATHRVDGPATPRLVQRPGVVGDWLYGRRTYCTYVMCLNRPEDGA